MLFCARSIVVLLLNTGPSVLEIKNKLDKTIDRCQSRGHVNLWLACKFVIVMDNFLDGTVKVFYSVN